MKTNTKMISSVVMAAALLMLPRAQAANSGVTPAVTPAATATATNANPIDRLAALFPDPVIAKGKGFEVKKSELEAAMDDIKDQAAAQGQTIPQDELKVTVLNSLIGNQILLQKATDADKAQGKTDADQYIAQKVKQFGSQTAVEVQLKAAGKTFAAWRDEITDQRTAMAVMIRELNAAPTEAEIKKYYDDHPTASEVPELVHVRHILLLTIDTNSPTRTPLTDAQTKAKKKQIDDILKQARSGNDFAALAKQYSEDLVTKASGGELPQFPRGQMVPAFETMAFSLTNNQISDVVTTEYGYHIIQLLDKTAAKKVALTDKVPSGDATLADAIKELLTRQKLRELAPAYIENLGKSPGVEILDPALKALMAAQTNAPAAPSTTPKP
jgi:parvulin-like peptidyl-prolyl isomerase